MNSEYDPKIATDKEQYLIGLLLTNHDQWDEVVRLVPSEVVFTSQVNQLLYRTMLESYHSGEKIDSLILVDKLKKNGKKLTATQEAEILLLPDHVYSQSPPITYCELLVREYQQRQLAQSFLTLSEKAKDGIVGPSELVADAQSELLKAMVFTPPKRVSVVQGLQGRIEKLFSPPKDGASARIKTRITALNNKLGGLYRGDLVVVGAQPSMGKTSFCLDICVYNLNFGLKSLYISRDQQTTDLALRILTAKTEIRKQDITPDMSQSDQNKLFSVATKMHSAMENIQVIEEPISATEVATEARRMKREMGLDIIVVDYITLLKKPNGFENQNMWIGDMLVCLKDLAKELDVVMIVVSQLNRSRSSASFDIKQQMYAMPSMSMLRDSGSLEQDANVVIMPHIPREILKDRLGEGSIAFSQTLEDDPRLKDQAFIVIAKNKDGEKGQVECKFKYGQALFVENER